MEPSSKLPSRTFPSALALDQRRVVVLAMAKLVRARSRALGHVRHQQETLVEEVDTTVEIPTARDPMEEEVRFGIPTVPFHVLGPVLALVQDHLCHVEETDSRDVDLLVMRGVERVIGEVVQDHEVTQYAQVGREEPDHPHVHPALAPDHALRCHLTPGTLVAGAVLGQSAVVGGVTVGTTSEIVDQGLPATKDSFFPSSLSFLLRCFSPCSHIYLVLLYSKVSCIVHPSSVNLPFSAYCTKLVHGVCQSLAVDSSSARKGLK